MSIIDQIKNVFPFNISDISDDFIENNPDIMEIGMDNKLEEYLPAYMLWCVRNRDISLVDSYTINALAEYGRAKDSTNIHLNFKFRCNQSQVEAVIKFLNWCKSELLSNDQDQIDRAIKNWDKISC